jgi:hypothetical protein
MTRVFRHPRFVALFVAGLAGVAGCSPSQQSQQSQSDTRTAVRARTTASLRPRIAMDADRLARLATNYRFNQDRDPDPATMSVVTGKNPGVKRKDKPTLKIATAEPGQETTDGEFIARIRSDKRYDGLGIGKGESFIWRDRRGSTKPEDWEVFMISTDPFNVTRLARQKDQLSSGSAAVPRIASYEFLSPTASKLSPVEMVAYGLCIEDPACQPSDHCGYNNQ